MKMNLSLALGINGPVSDPAATALIARFTTPPTVARAIVINTTILMLKVGGPWAKADLIYFPAAADSQAALLNWVSTSFNATAVNAPAFVADRGFTGNGTNSYLNTGWTPSASALFLQNTATVAAWVNAGTNAADSNKSSIGSVDGTSGSFISPRGAGDVSRGRMNGASTQNYGASASILGLTALCRTTSVLTTSYKNGVSTGTNASASAARSGVAAYVGGFNNNGTPANLSDFRVPFVFIGGALTPDEHLSLYNAANYYLTAVGGN